MEIKHTDGKVTDTSDMDDITAMILEKAEEFRIMCNENGRPFVLIVEANPKKVHHNMFWGLNRAGLHPGKNEKDSQTCFNNMMEMVNGFVRHISNGVFTIGRPQQ
jgi:hypothetical protein